MELMSALRPPVSPDLSGSSFLKAGQLSGGKIPLAELEKLPPGAWSQPAAALEPGTLPQPVAGGGSNDSFSKVLGNMVGEVNGKQVAAGEVVNGLLSGQHVSLHQAMLAMEEASVSFQLMVEVRNKLLESYQELMRMQI